MPLLRCRAAMGRAGELLQGPVGDFKRVSRCSGMISFDVVGVASPVKLAKTITSWWSRAVVTVTHCCWCCCCCCCVAAAAAPAAAAAAAVSSDSAAVHSREVTVAAVQASWHMALHPNSNRVEDGSAGVFDVSSGPSQHATEVEGVPIMQDCVGYRLAGLKP